MAEAEAFATPSSVPDLIAFTLFPKLPVEIQLKIWKLTMPGPRIIKVKVFAPQTIYDPDYVLTPGETSSEYLHDHPVFQDPERMSLEMEKAVQSLVLTVDLKSPALLFSCKISRDVALTTYTQCFELGCGRKVRFDPARDALFLSTICQSWLQPLPGMQQSPESVPDYKGWFTGVTKLTLGASLVSALVMRGDLSFGWFLSHFQSLETLILLANEADHTVSLLKMREEVQFNGLGETLAKRYADQTDVRRADLISAHSQRWALLGELLKMEIEDYHIHNSSPAGWKCPEIEAMYLDTSSPLGRS